MWVDDGFGGSFTLLFSREERNNKEKKSNTKRGFEHERNDKEKKIYSARHQILWVC